MDGAYFVGRQELLNWINGFLGSSYKKVEETASGAAVCQIFEALHPGSVSINVAQDTEISQKYLLRAFSFILTISSFLLLTAVTAFEGKL